MEILKNSIHTLTIDSYSSEGDGIGRLNGIATFVKGALNGEEVEVKITKVDKNCLWARLIKVIKASPHRIKLDCSIANKCGGCRLRHMSYEEELTFKLQRVNDALNRIGKLDFRVEKIHGCQDNLRYRNKATFPVSQNKDGNIDIGLFQERSHNVINVESCLIQSEQAEAVISVVRNWMVDNNISAYCEQTKKGTVRHIYIRTNILGKVLVCIITNSDELPAKNQLIDSFKNFDLDIVGIVHNVNKTNTNVILGKQFRTIWGENYIEDEICDLKFKLSVPSFFQVNRHQAEILYNLVLDFLNLNGKENIIDLYCGTGTITLFLSRYAKFVYGVEVVSEAIENAIENAKVNNILNVKFICSTSDCATQKFLDKNIKADIICVDPPRKGLDSNTINSIIKLSPKKIMYVSCDPATLARDLSIFEQANYKLTKLECVDMFPRTPHIESVCLLSKPN